MKILSISHYDLDGFGCQLCIYEKFKNYNIVFDNCGYNKINKTLDKYDFNNFDLVFITDLNFTIKNQELLYDKLLDYKGKCIYIDHHQYDTTEILDKSNCKVIIDDTKSATLKTYEVLKLNNSNLLKLCKVIDIYDMWRTKNKHFQKALEELKKALQKNNTPYKKSLILFLLARSYDLLNNRIEAIKYYKKSLSTLPSQETIIRKKIYKHIKKPYTISDIHKFYIDFMLADIYE